MAMYIDPESGIGYTIQDESDLVGGSTPPSGGGTPDQNPTTPPVNTAVSAAEQQVIDWYKQNLGRDPNPGDVQKWLSGEYGWGSASNMQGILTGIKMSDEGAQYSSQHTTPANTQNTAAGAFQTTGNNYVNFDTARLQQPTKSAKDAFVMLSNQAPSPPMGNKAALGEWFKKYIQPGMNNLGHVVKSVNGDSFTYSNAEGTFTVDYVAGAGAAGAKLNWGAVAGDAATAAKYGVSVGGSGGGGGGGTGGGGGGAYGGGGSTTSGFPTLDIPSYEDIYGDYVPGTFTAPDPADVHKDPAYQFRFQEGMKPLANSLAMSGMMKSGATAKALQRYGQGFASDEYDKIFGRALTTYDLNEKNRFGAFTTNKDYYNKKYGFDVDEATGEYGAKFNTAKLGFDRDWDIYKYQNDDAYRYWNSKLGAATQGSQFGNDQD